MIKLSGRREGAAGTFWRRRRDTSPRRSAAREQQRPRKTAPLGGDHASKQLALDRDKKSMQQNLDGGRDKARSARRAGRRGVAAGDASRRLLRRRSRGGDVDGGRARAAGTSRGLAEFVGAAVVARTDWSTPPPPPPPRPPSTCSARHRLRRRRRRPRGMSDGPLTGVASRRRPRAGRLTQRTRTPTAAQSRSGRPLAASRLQLPAHARPVGSSSPRAPWPRRHDHVRRRGGGREPCCSGAAD